MRRDTWTAAADGHVDGDKLCAPMSSDAERVFVEVGLDGSAVSAAQPSPRALKASTCRKRTCFEKLVRSRAHPPSLTVVIAVTNAGFAPFWHNLRCSLERLRLDQHAIIVGTDAAACSAAAAPGVACVDGGRVFWASGASGGSGAPSLARGAVEHGTRAYADLMHVKARPCLEVLRLGYGVLYTDTDVVWLRDPLAHLLSLADADAKADARAAATPHAADGAAGGAAGASGRVDLWIQSDHDESNDAPCDSHERCARSHWCERGACASEVPPLPALLLHHPPSRDHLPARLRPHQPTY